MKKLLFAVAIVFATMFASCGGNCVTQQCDENDSTTCVVDSDSVVVDSLEITE